jgi:hypothetical protein
MITKTMLVYSMLASFVSGGITATILIACLLPRKEPKP